MTMTAGALRRRDIRERRGRHHGARVDTQLHWQINRSHALDFNQDYTPQAMCCGRCGRPIEDELLEDQAGRPACSEACAAGPHFTADECATANPFEDSGPSQGHIPRCLTPERMRIDAMKERLRAIPEPFEVVLLPGEIPG